MIREEARGRAIFAALLLLAGCRSNGNRGHEREHEARPYFRGLSAWRIVPPHPAPPEARLPMRAEHRDTTTLVALARSMVEAQLAEGRLTLARGASHEARIYAAEVVSEAETHLAALSTLQAARPRDLAAVQDDPVLTAQREAAKHDLATLSELPAADVVPAWISSEARRLTLFSSIAMLGVRTARDVPTGNVFRMIAHDARERAHRAAAVAARIGTEKK
ncbi:Hypothetical protein A7982_05310 [Minicystis rosea]|nr:Hypothetical protein A7982_05310 [Minicystis rosea]